MFLHDPPSLSLEISTSEDHRPVLDFTKHSLARGRFNDCYFSRLEIHEIDKTGKSIKLMRDLEQTDSAKTYLDTVVYGVPPTGWKQLKTPEPLEDGAYYYLNKTKIFRRDRDRFYVVPGEFYSAEKISAALNHWRNKHPISFPILRSEQ